MEERGGGTGAPRKKSGSTRVLLEKFLQEKVRKAKNRLEKKLPKQQSDQATLFSNTVCPSVFSHGFRLSSIVSSRLSLATVPPMRSRAASPAAKHLKYPQIPANNTPVLRYTTLRAHHQTAQKYCLTFPPTPVYWFY